MSTYSGNSIKIHNSGKISTGRDDGMVDMQDLGSCASNSVQVQVLFPAQTFFDFLVKSGRL